jgi:diguanylate cyclase (GGDEF)-like protein
MPPCPASLQALVAGLEHSELFVAVYDPQDRLRWANRSFRDLFLRGLEPPVAFADVLRHGHRGGFGVLIGSGDVEAFLADILPRRRAKPSRTLLGDTVDGRWLQWTETLLGDGWMLTVASDITALKQQERRIAQLHADAVQASLTDPLTGVSNRRHILELAEQALHERARHGTPMSIALLDIDHFKQVNDSHGHQAGDEVLRAFARQYRAHLRPRDGVGRIGGEEFMLLLPGADLPTATAIVERLREAMPATPSGCTFSGGLAAPRRGEGVDALLQRADAALYAAKRAGRNRCIVDGEAPEAQDSLL